MPTGFVFGDHQFYAPEERAPLKRPARKGPIKGASAPACFAGMLRPSTKASPAAGDLLTGGFCGHGEPTYTVFDVVLGGGDVVEVCVEHDEEGEVMLVLCREDAAGALKPGARGAKATSPWRVLYDAAWVEQGEGLVGLEAGAAGAEQVARVNSQVERGHMSIGFEYPADAESAEHVSWLSIHVRDPGGDETFEMVDAELM